jgi:hypothetical protein
MATHARSYADAHGPEVALAAASGLTVGAVLIGAWTLPFDLILPFTSVVLLVAGFVLALAARKRPAHRDRLSYRDVAALLVFFGFGAALLSDPAALLLLDAESR